VARAEPVGYAARDPQNIVHLILPEAPSGADQYADAAARLTAWRREGVLRRDPGEAVYVVAQDYGLPSGERRTRLGMFAAVRAEPFTTRRVRPHEQTHSAPKADRLALLRATRTSLESIFLLAPDPNRALAQAIAQAARGLPAARAELDGVGIRMWSVTGARGAELLAEPGRDGTACIVVFPDDYDVTLVLKPDAALDRVPGMARTPAVRALDVARIETLVVQYILGAGTATPSLAYTPDPRAAFE